MTAAELAARHRRRAAALALDLTQTARAIGISARRFSRELLTAQVYAIPEDVSRTGKKKWRRTGQLRRAERYEVVAPGEVHIVNDLVYAEPRHEAGKPGRRRINPLRVSHWRDEMAEVMRPIALDQFHQAILDNLRQGGD